MRIQTKREIVRALQSRLEGALERLTAAQRSVQQGATHPDARQEHSKDMRSTEASYLARGLAERVETLRDAIRTLALMPIRDFDEEDAVVPGAIVHISDGDGRETAYLLAPAGGGEVLDADGEPVLVITPHSPLGRALAGRRTGDAVSVELPGGRLDAEITGIA